MKDIDSEREKECTEKDQDMNLVIPFNMWNFNQQHARTIEPKNQKIKLPFSLFFNKKKILITRKR